MGSARWDVCVCVCRVLSRHMKVRLTLLQDRAFMMEIERYDPLGTIMRGLRWVEAQPSLLNCWWRGSSLTCRERFRNVGDSVS